MDLSRAQWGAGPHRAGTIRTPVDRLIGHHGVVPFWRGQAAARNLQRIARERGMVDASYNQAADAGGLWIELRGWGRQGGHTLGHNDQHALCYVGDLEAHQMPAPMERAAVRIVRDHRRFGPGRITHHHRDLGSTACPGRNGVAATPRINQLAGGPGTPPPAAGDDEMREADWDRMQKLVRAVNNEGAMQGQTNWAAQERGSASHIRKIREAVDEGLSAKRIASIVRGVLNEGAMQDQTNWAGQERGSASHLRKTRSAIEAGMAEIRDRLDQLERNG